MIEAAWCRFFAIYPRTFLRSRSILPHPPLHRNDCSHSRFARSHPLCGRLWANQKREIPNVGGIATVIIRSFGHAETTFFFRIAAPSFYRLSRQSVANLFPQSRVAGRQEYGFACKTVWFVLLSVLPFSLFSASLYVCFSQLHLRPFVFERQIYFGRQIRKSSGLRPLSRKK